jgi:hypothetical protein
MDDLFLSLEPRFTRRLHKWPLLISAVQRGDDVAPFGSRTVSNVASSYDGWTVLHYAGYHGKADYAGLVLAHGAAVDARTDTNQETPLHTCARRGDRCADAAAVLLASGANVSAENLHGRTPLHLAARLGNVEMVRLLLQWGAPPVALARHPAGGGDFALFGANIVATPLWDAIHNGHVEAGRILVEAGADPAADPGHPRLELMAEARGPPSLLCLQQCSEHWSASRFLQEYAPDHSPLRPRAPCSERQPAVAARHSD